MCHQTDSVMLRDEASLFHGWAKQNTSSAEHPPPPIHTTPLPEGQGGEAGGVVTSILQPVFPIWTAAELWLTPCERFIVGLRHVAAVNTGLAPAIPYVEQREKILQWSKLHYCGRSVTSQLCVRFLTNPLHDLSSNTTSGLQPSTMCWIICWGSPIFTAFFLSPLTSILSSF